MGGDKNVGDNVFIFCFVLTGKNCILVFTSTLVDEASGLLTVAGPAISFGKDTYSTIPYAPNAMSVQFRAKYK